MRAFCVFVFVCLTFGAPAQQLFRFGEGISVVVGGDQVQMPFAVGFNAAQIQRMDIDGDHIDEWIVWDINARRILVFSEDEGGFRYRPELAYLFPSDIAGFLVLRDFDGDGKKDIFTSSPFGIRAYRNSSPTNAQSPQWTLAQNFLRLDNGSNLQANNLDVPLVADLDGDGDLDFVTFNFASGDYLEYYQNTSIERKGHADVDGFAFPVSHWGNFEFCDCGAFSFGISCTGIPFARLDENQGIQHAGGHSILYEDFNGDGTRDLLLGRDECGSLYFLPNKGTHQVPVFDGYSQTLPGFGLLPEFPIFHTAYLDHQDLVISSNTSELAATFQSDFARNSFSLSPIGSPSPTLKPFLQNQLLDFGENSRPFFKGLKENGELILTANSYWNGKVIGLAYRILVGGTEWELLESDYLGLSEWDLLDLQYLEFTNQQNQREYWIGGIDTVGNFLQRRVWRGFSPVQEQMTEVVFPGTGIRPLDQIELFSYQNKDYLLLARQTGELVLFGLSDAGGNELTLKERNLLGFADNPANRNLSVHVIDGETPALFFVDQNGTLQYISDFMRQSERQQVNIVLGENSTTTTRLSRNSWITSLPAVFGLSRDLVLGNTAGGLEYFSATEQDGGGFDFQVKVYPNPNSGEFYVAVSKPSRLRIINSLGQILVEKVQIPVGVPYLVRYPYMATGLYILQFESENKEYISKKMWVHQ